jgi:hypothetical protein
MPKESSFAADQPTIHLLFGSSAIKEINAYVPRMPRWRSWGL